MPRPRNRAGRQAAPVRAGNGPGIPPRTDCQTRAISVRNSHPRLRFHPAEVVRVLTTLESGLAKLRIPPSAVPAGELSIVFLTDAALAGIHARFLGDPAVTDVITFAGDPATGLAGEICVSADAAVRQAVPTAGGSDRIRETFAAELTLYLIHGWLHLAGFDDLKPAKKRRMRAAEGRAIALLRGARAIPGFRLLSRRRESTAID